MKSHVFVYCSLLNQLTDASQISVQSALDTGGASHLNGARFSTLSSLMDTNAMGRCTMPEIRSLWISLSIMITIATELKIDNERQFKGYVRLI
jgi:hypothetical protein